MIQPIEKEKIIQVLGNHYTPKILQYFEEKEITNSKNKPFSSESIRNIVCGEENLEIEFQIMDFVIKEEKRQKKLLQKRQNLLTK